MRTLRAESPSIFLDQSGRGGRLCEPARLCAMQGLNNYYFQTYCGVSDLLVLKTFVQKIAKFMPVNDTYVSLLLSIYGNILLRVLTEM